MRRANTCSPMNSSLGKPSSRLETRKLLKMPCSRRNQIHSLLRSKSSRKTMYKSFLVGSDKATHHLTPNNQQQINFHKITTTKKQHLSKIVSNSRLVNKLSKRSQPRRQTSFVIQNCLTKTNLLRRPLLRLREVKLSRNNRLIQQRSICTR